MNDSRKSFHDFVLRMRAEDKAKGKPHPWRVKKGDVYKFYKENRVAHYGSLTNPAYIHDKNRPSTNGKYTSISRSAVLSGKSTSGIKTS